MKVMATKLRYKVAGHAFEFVLADNFPEGRVFLPYTPFADAGDDAPLFRMRVERAPLPPTGRLIRLCNDEPPYLWIYEAAAGNDCRAEDAADKCFGHSMRPDAPKAILRVEGDEALLSIAPECGRSEADMAVNNSAMLLYTWKSGTKETLLLHASAPVRKGRGYVFLGRSGTGKSTHSRMWLENLDGCELLNDDNPVLRIEEGVPMLYGSPWSGKTPCWKNMAAPLGGIVRIVRAKENRAVRLSALQSFASLSASCSSIIWDRSWKNIQEDCIEKIVGLCPGWNMECLPDGDAARVCSRAVEAAAGTLEDNGKIRR